jgi:putative endonuclease
MALFSPSRWPWWRRWFGRRSERAAEGFLKRLGWRIVERNYTCPGGELDLIALAGRELVFVEIRSTAQPDPAVPAASVDAGKQQRMTRAARHFLHRSRLDDSPCRFDVLLLSWPPGERSPRVLHIPNAFEAA